MKKFDKEIDQLRKIEHTQEEKVELRKIDNELEQIRNTRQQLNEERRQLNTEYNAYHIPKSREDKILNRLHEIRQETELLQSKEDSLTFSKKNIFQRVEEMKRGEAEKKLAELNEELLNIRYMKQQAVNSFNKNLFDQLQERETAAEAEKAEITATIEASRAAVSEMTTAAEILREKIRKQTAAEAVKLFDQLAELLDMRTAEENEIRSIEDAYNNSDSSYYSSLFDPFNDLRRGLSNNSYLIKKLREQAAE